MGETRPSMIRSCRVWLEGREDISDEKRLCINALFARAAPVEVNVHIGERIICPSCGSGIRSSIKFCDQCGQRVIVRRQAIYCEAMMEEAFRRRQNGETVANIADSMGINRSTLGTYLHRYSLGKTERRKNRRYTVGELTKAYERHNDGESWGSIAASLGRNEESLKQAVRKFYKNKEDTQNG